MSLYNIIRIDLKKGKIIAEEEAEKLKNLDTKNLKIHCQGKNMHEDEINYYLSNKFFILFTM